MLFEVVVVELLEDESSVVEVVAGAGGDTAGVEAGVVAGAFVVVSDEVVSGEVVSDEVESELVSFFT